MCILNLKVDYILYNSSFLHNYGNQNFILFIHDIMKMYSNMDIKMPVLILVPYSFKIIPLMHH